MQLTRKQEEGLRRAVERYRAGEAYTCITGYAGAGKSTLVRFIIEALDVPEDLVVYATYTGKAAQVLRNKGNDNAITLHKLLYQAHANTKTGKYRFEPKKTLDKPYQIIVVDEVSMVNQQMWDLLLSHGVYVLACGDPGQLSPISGGTTDVILHPHVFLDEIMRQALDSEIIRLATHIRNGRPLSTFNCLQEEVMIKERWEFEPSMLLWADQTLCALNATRVKYNNLCRELKGFKPFPQVGDKVIDLHNEWEILSDKNSPLTNGCLGNILSISRKSLYCRTKGCPYSIPVFNITMETDTGEIFSDLIVDANALESETQTLNDKQKFDMRKNRRAPDPPLDFTYGYVLTGWKAQGSEWGKVLVMEENFPYDWTEKIKYLYTCATRASNRLVVIKK